MDENLWRAVLIMAAIFAGAIASTEVGFRIGRRSPPKETDRSHLGAVQGAILGLLGLLLGFSFAGATQRFIDRQRLIVEEANAIGTAYLRADVLDPVYRDPLQRSLAAYAAERAAAFGAGKTASDRRAAEARCVELQDAMWRAALAGVEARPGMVMAVLPPVNEVIDLDSMRWAASRRHLPGPVLGLLMLCAGLSLVTIGFGFGLTRRRHPGLSGTLAITIAAAIWMTIDLDFPRAGIIRLDDGPLNQLRFPERAPSPGPE